MQRRVDRLQSVPLWYLRCRGPLVAGCRWVDKRLPSRPQAGEGALARRVRRVARRAVRRRAAEGGDAQRIDPGGGRARGHAPRYRRRRRLGIERRGGTLCDSARERRLGEGDTDRSITLCVPGRSRLTPTFVQPPSETEIFVAEPYVLLLQFLQPHRRQWKRDGLVGCQAQGGAEFGDGVLKLSESERDGGSSGRRVCSRLGHMPYV